MIRLAIVGVGGYGKQLVGWIQQVSEKAGCRLIAAADARWDQFPDLHEQLQKAGVEIHHNAMEMFRALKGRCEGVYIATGIGSHAALTSAAAENGFHIHLEKPPAATVQEVDFMLDAVHKHNRFCLVGFQALQSDDVRLVKDRVVSGRLGKIKTISCHAGWPRTTAYYSRNDWAGKLRLGKAWVLDGPATNALAHQIANMLFWASPKADTLATPASVRAEFYAAGPIESHDTAAIEIKTVEGPTLYFLATHCSQNLFGPTIRIDAEDGSVNWDFQKNFQIKYKNGSQESASWDEEQFGKQIVNFVEALRSDSGASLRCPLAESRKVVLALNGAHESAGRIQRIDASYTELAPGESDSTRTVVPGIDDFIHFAAKSNSLLSDLRPAPPWVKSTQAFDLDGYKIFPQKFRCD
jgi:predicted dehydrogenase